MEDLPRTVTNAVSGLGYDVTLTEIELKHQPSWQLFKVRSSSSNYPGAYSEEEYFYYYDQLNRVSRHYTHYDIQGGSYNFEADDAWFNDTLITSGNWPSDYSEAGSYPGHFPLTDATANAQKNNLRTIAFQKTSWTKNNVDEDPLMRSEYYFYDARWNDPVLRNRSTVHYNGPVCSDPPLGGDSPCISIKWAGSVDNVMEQVPFGYCAYLTLDGAIACPFDVDPTTCADSIISLIGCYPVELSPEEEDSTGKAPLEAQPLDAGMYLKNVVVQIDTIPQTTDGNLWVSNRNDKSNDYIMDFYLTETEDALVRRISVPLYPYDTLTVRSIDERNRYTQVQLEHNATDIYTHYEYEVPERIWHINDNATASCPGYGNYSSVINKNIGLPTRIIVGYGRADSLTTDYTYHPNYSLNTITNPNGYDLRYEYDDYDRLTKTYENERLLSENDYEYWNRDTSLNFAERTAQNYVENTVYNSAISGGTFEGERMRAFIDPLGRNYSAVTAIDGDSTQVHSGTIHYDNWGRTVRAHKPYALSGQ
ncbi:MAG: hypothetical protein MI810_10240, partial [Flavobacteriales bacterium]|nr:hypothetical protein [Flavobacteriales bacterium]